VLEHYEARLFILVIFFVKKKTKEKKSQGLVTEKITLILKKFVSLLLFLFLSFFLSYLGK
jgi:hypothetical protein